MEQSFVVDGKQFILSSVSGTVLSEKRTSTTQVTGRVSNDLFGGVQGKIKSETMVNQEVWIRRDDNGCDFVIKFPEDIPLLEGQRITAVSISHDNSPRWVFFRNEAASTNYQIMGSQGFLYRYWGKNSGCLILAVMLIIMFYLVPLLGSKLVFFGCVALLVALWVMSVKKRNRRKAVYREELERILTASGIAFTVQ